MALDPGLAEYFEPDEYDLEDAPAEFERAAVDALRELEPEIRKLEAASISAVSGVEERVHAEFEMTSIIELIRDGIAEPDELTNVDDLVVALRSGQEVEEAFASAVGALPEEAYLPIPTPFSETVDPPDGGFTTETPPAMEFRGGRARISDEPPAFMPVTSSSILGRGLSAVTSFYGGGSARAAAEAGSALAGELRRLERSGETRPLRRYGITGASQRDDLLRVTTIALDDTARQTSSGSEAWSTVLRSQFLPVFRPGARADEATIASMQRTLSTIHRIPFGPEWNRGHLRTQHNMLAWMLGYGPDQWPQYPENVRLNRRAYDIAELSYSPEQWEDIVAAARRNGLPIVDEWAEIDASTWPSNIIPPERLAEQLEIERVAAGLTVAAV